MRYDIQLICYKPGWDDIIQNSLPDETYIWSIGNIIYYFTELTDDEYLLFYLATSEIRATDNLRILKESDFQNHTPLPQIDDKSNKNFIENIIRRGAKKIQR